VHVLHRDAGRKSPKFESVLTLFDASVGGEVTPLEFLPRSLASKN